MKISFFSFAETVFISVVLVTTVIAQRENMGVPGESWPDVVTVPDGTPLTLSLNTTLSSATAKVGDVVGFTVFYPVQVQKMLLVRQGTSVSGTVVKVRHRGRFARDGEVAVAIKDLVLPDGETVSLRQSLEPAKSRGKGSYSVSQTAVESAPTFGVALPMAVLIKGQEKAYPGVISLTTVYMNGPLVLRALATLPYKGPAQVFFKNEEGDPAGMFVGTDFVGQLSEFLVIDLRPGRYSFSTDKSDEPLQLDLLNDHQYWVERRDRRFIADDPQRHEEEIKKLANDPEILVRNLIQTP